MDLDARRLLVKAVIVCTTVIPSIEVMAASQVIAMQGPDLIRNCQYFKTSDDPGQWYGFSLPSTVNGQSIHTEGAGSLAMLLTADAQGLALAFHLTGGSACPSSFGSYPEVDQLQIIR